MMSIDRSLTRRWWDHFAWCFVSVYISSRTACRVGTRAYQWMVSRCFLNGWCDQLVFRQLDHFATCSVLTLRVIGRLGLEWCQGGKRCLSFKVESHGVCRDKTGFECCSVDCPGLVCLVMTGFVWTLIMDVPARQDGLIGDDEGWTDVVQGV